MKMADIVLVRSRDWIGGLIEEVSGSEYSHAAGIVMCGEIIEAQGFQKTGYEGLHKYKGSADIYTYDGMTSAQREKILTYVGLQVGTRYNWTLLIIEAFRYWLHNNSLLSLYKEPYQSHICSTLWANAYRFAGIDLCPGIKYPTPGDLANSRLLRKIESI